MGDWGLRHDDGEPRWPFDADLDLETELDELGYRCPGCAAAVAHPDMLCGVCEHCAVCGAIKERASACDCEVM